MLKYLITSIILAGIVMEIPGTESTSRSPYEIYRLTGSVYSSKNNALTLTNAAPPTVFDPSLAWPQLSLIPIGTPIATGTDPLEGVNSIPLGKCFYASNHVSYNISAYSINTTTGLLTLVGTYSSSPNPNLGSAVDKSEKFLIVANPDTAKLSTYSINQTTCELTYIMTIDSETSTRYPVVSDSRVYVSNYTAQTVGAFNLNPTTGYLTAIGSKSTNGKARGICIDPQYRFLWTISDTTNTYTGFSIGTTGALTQIENKSLGTYPQKCWVDTSGNYLYYTDCTDNVVGVMAINQTTGVLTTVGTTATGNCPTGMSIAGNRLYVTNETDNTVYSYVINPATHLPVLKSTAATGVLPIKPVSDVRTNFVYVQNRTDNTISQFSDSVSTKGIYSPAGKTNFIKGRQSFESYTAGIPNGWDGYYISTEWAQYKADPFDKLSSIKNERTAHQAYFWGPCSTDTINDGSSFYGRAYYKVLSGTADCGLGYRKFSDSACSISAGNTIFAGIDTLSATSWTELGATFSTSATFSSWQPYIYCTSGTSSLLWDAFEIYPGTLTSNDVCSVDADTTAVCNHSIYSGTNQTGAGSFHLSMSFQMPFSMTSSTSTLFAVPATSGSNNKMLLTLASNNLSWSVWTSAGVEKNATVACVIAANTSKKIRAYHTIDGKIWACCGSTCSTRTTGATITTPSTTFYLGSDGTTAGDVWIKDFKIYKNTR